MQKNEITVALWNTTAAPITTFTKSCDDPANKFDDVLVFLKSIDDEIKQIELILEEHSAPYTPGVLLSGERIIKNDYLIDYQNIIL